MKKILKALLKKIDSILFIKLRYKSVMGYMPNLKEPKYLSEKILWLSLFYYPNYRLAYILGDKYGLRKVLEKSSLREYLPPIIGEYTSVDEINFESLPSAFVIKKSNASNMNAIINNKNNIDYGILKEKVNNWMKQDYGDISGERHYSKMTSMILIEEFLNIEKEYQIFCFNGVPKFVSTVEFRMIDNKQTDFKEKKEVTKKEIIDIEELKKNSSIADILSKIYEYIKEIPLVRVDIIVTDSGIYIGELTFTPAGGLLPNYDKELQEKLGSYITLPKI